MVHRKTTCLPLALKMHLSYVVRVTALYAVSRISESIMIIYINVPTSWRIPYI